MDEGGRIGKVGLEDVAGRHAPRGAGHVVGAARRLRRAAAAADGPPSRKPSAHIEPRKLRARHGGRKVVELSPERRGPLRPLGIRRKVVAHVGRKRPGHREVYGRRGRVVENASRIDMAKVAGFGGNLQDDAIWIGAAGRTGSSGGSKVCHRGGDPGQGGAAAPRAGGNRLQDTRPFRSDLDAQVQEPKPVHAFGETTEFGLHADDSFFGLRFRMKIADTEHSRILPIVNAGQKNCRHPADKRIRRMQKGTRAWRNRHQKDR